MKRSILLCALACLTAACAVLPAAGCRNRTNCRVYGPSGASAASSAVSSAVSSAASPAASSTASSRAALSSAVDSIEKASSAPSLYPKPFKVLMYHSIAIEAGNNLRIPPDDFDKQMAWLHDNGWKPVALDELYAWIEKGEPFPEKTVAITLDDGYIDNYTSAFPILKKYGFTATIFMITDFIGRDAYLTADQIKEMSDAGIHFESHTLNHPDLSTLSYDEQLRQLTESKARLGQLTGKPVTMLCYPSGKHNADTVRAAEAAGYRMAFTMKGPWKDPSQILYLFPRIYITKDFAKFEEAMQ